MTEREKERVHVRGKGDRKRERGSELFYKIYVNFLTIICPNKEVF